MTLPNSSPALKENIKSGFARLAENLRSIEHPDAQTLAQRCEECAGGAAPRSDKADREHRDEVDYGMRMWRERNRLLGVLFKSEQNRREVFEWLCENGDVPELYRNDYAKV